MSASDSHATIPDPGQRVGADVDPVDTEDVRSRGAGARVRKNAVAATLFSAGGPSQADEILSKHAPFSVHLSPDHLWSAYMVEEHVVAEVKHHIAGKGWFTGEGKWSRHNVPPKEGFANQEYPTGANPFAFFSDLFNVIVGYFRTHGRVTSVQAMVHVNSIGPNSPGITSNCPDAFLQMDSASMSTEGQHQWRDITCPFKYIFGDSNSFDVRQRHKCFHDQRSNAHGLQADTEVLWSLCHIMQSDPRRMFSFGSTIHGTLFHICLLSRAAFFTCTAFDWYNVSPDL